MKKDPLFEYIEEMKKIVDCMARGMYVMQTSDGTNLYFDPEVALANGQISIGEENILDDLETSTYTEMGSLERITEFINSGDYYTARETIDEIISKKMSEEQIPEELKETCTKVYENIMSRFKTIMKDLILKLCMGLKIELTTDEVSELWLEYITKGLQEKLSNELMRAISELNLREQEGDEPDDMEEETRDTEEFGEEPNDDELDSEDEQDLEIDENDVETIYEDRELTEEEIAQEKAEEEYMEEMKEKFATFGVEAYMDEERILRIKIPQ